MTTPMLTLADTVQDDQLSNRAQDCFFFCFFLNGSNTHPSKPLPDHRCGVRLITAFCPFRMTATRKGFCEKKTSRDTSRDTTFREN